jgi:hypothetical protein
MMALAGDRRGRTSRARWWQSCRACGPTPGSLLRPNAGRLLPGIDHRQTKDWPVLGILSQPGGDEVLKPLLAGFPCLPHDGWAALGDRCCLSADQNEEQLERHGPGEPTVRLSLTDEAFLRSDIWARLQLGSPLSVEG